MYLINTLLVKENINYNIRYTVMLLYNKLCVEKSKYENTVGIAIFAIGSLTIELFPELYNVTSEVVKSN